jgi:hypothetical protein
MFEELAGFIKTASLHLRNIEQEDLKRSGSDKKPKETSIPGCSEVNSMK